jgi:hypothetical protein
MNNNNSDDDVMVNEKKSNYNCNPYSDGLFQCFCCKKSHIPHAAYRNQFTLKELGVTL